MTLSTRVLLPLLALAPLPCALGAQSPARGAGPNAANSVTTTPAVATVTEVEPNDDLSTATPVALGDTIEGAADQPGDVDFFTLYLEAHTALDIDVDAQLNGSELDAVVTLFGPDGDSIAGNDDSSGADRLDSRLRFTVPVAGEYRVRIRDWRLQGGSGHFYRLKLLERGHGPADPTERLPGGPAGAAWMVASGHGGTWVAGSTGIWRVTADGAMTEVIPDSVLDLRYLVEIVVDPFGALLLRLLSPHDAGVLRLTAEGSLERLLDFAVTALAVAPDRWIWYARGDYLWRTDPFGLSRERFALVPGVSEILFSPSGDLLVRRGHTVSRVGGSGALEQLFTFEASGPQGPVFDVEFDARGFLYLVDYYGASLRLYDDAYRQVEDPFATTYLEGVRGVAFLRDASGISTSRLIATTGEVVVIGPAGVAAPGPDIGPALIRADASLPAAVMGAPFQHVMTPTVTGGVWSLGGGALPPGLTLGANGVLSGIPAASGEFEFIARVDAQDNWGGAQLRVQVSRPAIAVGAAADALLDGSALDADEVRFLDLQGNADGTYDVADFHAFVLSLDALPPAPPATEEP